MSAFDALFSVTYGVPALRLSDLAATVLPALPLPPLGKVAVPRLLEQPTGVILYDAMPCLSLAVALPTLRLLASRRGTSGDTFMCLVSLMLAVIYHYVHMQPDGLADTTFLGLDGPTWRTLDVIAVHLLLARVFAQAVGAMRVPGLRNVPTVLLPLLLLGKLMANETVLLSDTMSITAGTMLLTLVAKLGIPAAAAAAAPGVAALRSAASAGAPGMAALLGAAGAEACSASVVAATPQYPPYVCARLLAATAAAFGCFVLPGRMPHQYWLWHSLWHVFGGVLFYELYTHLDSCGWLGAVETQGPGRGEAREKCA